MTQHQVMAFLMAGGKGLRLHPLTFTVPKPLMPLDKETILESIITKLRNSGIADFQMSLGFQSALIKAFMNDKFPDLKCSFIEEEIPLGTAGSLRMIGKPLPYVLVCNCDILTDLSYEAFIRFHIDNKAAISIFGVEKEIEMPYGDLSTDEDKNLLFWKEKEKRNCLVSGGIYLINREVITTLIGNNGKLDMPELIFKAKEKGHSVKVFHHAGEWIDIGNLSQYELARQAFKNHPEKFL